MIQQNFFIKSFLMWFIHFYNVNNFCFGSENVSSQVNTSMSFSPHELSFEINTTDFLNISLSHPLNESLVIMFIEDPKGIVNLSENLNYSILTQSVEVVTLGVGAGHTLIIANTSSPYINVDDAYVNVQVYHSASLDIFSTVIGWIYFVFWTVSFYPQIYENFRRKSVVGLNLDYLILNLLGHLSYNFFNIGLYWIPTVQAEYFKQHPHGINPVQPNDIGFSIHAVFATSVTVVQACIYDRGDQKVSITCICLLSLMLIFLSISLILSIVQIITWLDYLYYFSYVKLLITLLKCCPQAFLNYKRKSTTGWSIGNVLMDFIGGFLSILQMFIIAYNFNDWSSIFGDPTKFGLGLFSVLFDILFMIQHYILYRRPTAKLFDDRADDGSHYAYTNEVMNYH